MTQTKGKKEMQEPTLGNPQNTIKILQKYGFTFQKNMDKTF